MKRISTTKIENILFYKMHLLLLILFFIVFTPLYSQINIINANNNIPDYYETTLQPSKKIDGIIIDNFNKLVSDKKVETDTTVTNKILRVWYTSTDLNIKIQVIDKNKNITIKVYNMLGKEILKVYEGTHINDEFTYSSQNNLPNGIYICVLQGDNFRNAEKIIISR